MAGVLRPVFGEHGSLQELYLDGEQVIRPWGLETAGACAFFSLETGGWDSQLLNRDVHPGEGRVATELTVRMDTGLWRAVLEEQVDGCSVTRHLKYTVLEDTWAMDLVLRFAFAQDAVQRADIAGHSITWDGSNRYHQYDTDSVLLHMRNDQRLQIEVTEVDVSEDWRLCSYVRCSPSEAAWIVHVRLLPAVWHREIIKLRLVGAQHWVLPEIVGDQILRNPVIARTLRYAGERNSRLGSRVNAYPLVKFQAGEVVRLGARVTLQ